MSIESLMTFIWSIIGWVIFVPVLGIVIKLNWLLLSFGWGLI